MLPPRQKLPAGHRALRAAGRRKPAFHACFPALSLGFLGGSSGLQDRNILLWGCRTSAKPWGENAAGGQTPPLGYLPGTSPAKARALRGRVLARGKRRRRDVPGSASDGEVCPPEPQRASGSWLPSLPRSRGKWALLTGWCQVLVRRANYPEEPWRVELGFSRGPSPDARFVLQSASPQDMSLLEGGG